VLDVPLEPLRGAAQDRAIAELAHLRERTAVRLLLCGAGTDAIPVVQLASLVGWLVTVVDHRPSFATHERVPDAEHVLCVNAAEDQHALARALQLDRFAAAVVMAHSAAHDRACLHALLAVPTLRYLGVLGPRRRTMELLEGALSPAGELPAHLHAPVGLDLGAETPEEIALAIMSECASVIAGRTPVSLRDRDGPIHVSR
jgi:xanthine/CO dehydrogenase XdhC/CoxF family maturation factor